jgi:hypothetical protein
MVRPHLDRRSSSSSSTTTTSTSRRQLRILQLRRKPCADRGVILCRRLVRSRRQRPAQGQLRCSFACRQVGEQLRVLLRRRDHSNTAVVLGGGPDHRGAANVDVFDARRKVRTLGHGLLKGVQVDHHQLEGRHTVLGQRGFVGGLAAYGKQSAVDFLSTSATKQIKKENKRARLSFFFFFSIFFSIFFLFFCLLVDRLLVVLDSPNKKKKKKKKKKK